MEVAIIMGAGPAGLTAGYELLTKTNIRPVIIEAENQVGGLSKTINYKGNLIDIGGHRFFSKSQKIIDWWLQFLPIDENAETGRVPIHYRNQSLSLAVNPRFMGSGENTMLVRPRKSRIYYNHHFFDYPLSLTGRTLKNLGFIKTCRIGCSYIIARLFPEKPERTLAQFFRNRFGKELYATFFKDYTEKVWGEPCELIPSAWGHQRIKNLNIRRAVVHALKSVFSSNTTLSQKGTETSLIEQFLYPKKGPGQMWETVAAKITEMGGTIHLSTKIENIIAENANRIKAVTCRDKNTETSFTLQGDYFFSSLPVKELINGMQGLDISKNIRAIANGLQYRDFLIVGLLLKNKDPLLTDNWIYLQDKGIKAGRLQIFNNWSPFMVNDPGTVCMGVEYFCNETDAFWQAADADIARQAIREIAGIGFIEAADVLDSTVIKVRKAYPAYTGSYTQFGVVQDFLNGIENLFAIGRNGMHRYNNSDHSMMTAMTAVDNILQGRKNKSNIWEVNLDEDYQEEW